MYLDLEAGTGYISLAIAERVNTVYAFDYDEDILNYLDTAAKEKELEILKLLQETLRISH